MADIGSIVDGKYKIIKQIGQGGMSVVYLAKEMEGNNHWAVKEVKKNSDPQSSKFIMNSLLLEAELIKKLQHQALPKIVDIVEEANTIYLIMEYIEGKTLNFLLEKGGALPQRKVIQWAKQLSRVLNYLHNQIPPVIYRDMKPSNIMIKPDGDIKLIDFGIAREYKEDNYQDTMNLGTIGYAAPEQFGGNGQSDARTDIYCLGVTLYYMVTGMNPSEPPYEIYPIRKWNSKLNVGLEKIIEKCTQRNPEDRYQSCAEVLYDLEHLKNKAFLFDIGNNVQGVMNGLFFYNNKKESDFDKNLTTLLQHDEQTSLMKDQGTEILNDENFNLENEKFTYSKNSQNQDTSLLNMENDGTQLLAENQICFPNNDNRSVFSQHKTDPNEYLESENDEFIILESITWIHTGEKE